MRLPAALDRAVPLVYGALAVAGIAAAVVPQHAGSIVRLLAATIAASAVLVVVAAAVADDADPGAGRRPPSPLDRPPSPPVRPIEAPGLTRARRGLLQEVARHRGDPTDPSAVAAAAERILDQQGRRT